MGFLSNLFTNNTSNIRKRKDQPDVYRIQDEDEAMNWAMEKSKLTLHYFEKCLQNPKPEQQYFSIKVKIIDDEKVEHIWLAEPSFDSEGNLFGIVGNNPIDVSNVKVDQKIGIDRNFVSDWMIIESGRLIGGYTIRAIRDGLNGRDLKRFDKSIGGMYIDEGEDYFLPSFETPEGAIVAIEEAYNSGNLDKIIECKNFTEEAKLMLKKLGKFESDEKIIEQTAEVLKLSFIKDLHENRMPNFEGIKRAFPFRQKISENHYLIYEICIFPDGGKSAQKLNTFRTNKGWRVLNPED